MSGNVQSNKQKNSDQEPDKARFVVIWQFVLEQLVDDSSGQQCDKQVGHGGVVLEVEDVTGPTDERSTGQNESSPLVENF